MHDCINCILCTDCVKASVRQIPEAWTRTRTWLVVGSTSSFCVSLSSPSFSSNWAAWWIERWEDDELKTRNCRVQHLPGMSSSSLVLLSHFFLLWFLARHELVVSYPVPCQIHLPCNLICFFLVQKETKWRHSLSSDAARSNCGLVGYTLLGPYPSSRLLWLESQRSAFVPKNDSHHSALSGQWYSWV